MKNKEEELTQKGWERRFIVSEPKLNEIIERYEESGFEVHLEPLNEVEERDEHGEKCQDCMICFEGSEQNYKIIYTRKKR